MRHLSLSLVLVTVLTGCGAIQQNTNAGYGNFVEQQPSAQGAKLADDAVLQLAASYAPAQTRFELRQATPDAFGRRLVESLRAKGYAVQEQKQPSGDHAGASANDTRLPAPTGLELNYIVDRAGNPPLYRLTVLVGSQSMTRAYLEQDGALKAAGAWVRKE